MYRDDRNWPLLIGTFLLFLAATLLWGYIAANAEPVGLGLFAEPTGTRVGQFAIDWGGSVDDPWRTPTPVIFDNRMPWTLHPEFFADKTISYAHHGIASGSVVSEMDKQYILTLARQWGYDGTPVTTFTPDVHERRFTTQQALTLTLAQHLETRTFNAITPPQVESKKKVPVQQPVSTTAAQPSSLIRPDLREKDLLNRMFLVTQLPNDRFVIAPRDGGFLSGAVTMADQDARNMGFTSAVSGVSGAPIVNPEPSSVVLILTGVGTLWLALHRKSPSRHGTPSGAMKL